MIDGSCEQCGGLIDRVYSKGPHHRFCASCSQKRKRKRYQEWAARDVNRVARNKYQQTTRAKHEIKWRCKRYGITVEYYESLSKECAICGVVDDLCFDHDHTTNKFRGLICRRCNRVLGQMEDRPDWLERAANYLLEKME